PSFGTAGAPLFAGLEIDAVEHAESRERSERGRKGFGAGSFCRLMGWKWWSLRGQALELGTVFLELDGLKTDLVQRAVVGIEHVADLAPIVAMQREKFEQRRRVLTDGARAGLLQGDR